jgi:hypothetical protein
MNVNVVLKRDDTYVEFTITKTPGDPNVVLYGDQLTIFSDVSDDITLYINEDSKVVIEFLDIDENVHVIPLCYADGFFGR